MGKFLPRLGADSSDAPSLSPSFGWEDAASAELLAEIHVVQVTVKVRIGTHPMAAISRHGMEQTEGNHAGVREFRQKDGSFSDLQSDTNNHQLFYQLVRRFAPTLDLDIFLL